MNKEAFGVVVLVLCAVVALAGLSYRNREVIFAWLNKDAEWWEFWHPSSGLFGGLIGGTAIVALLVALGAL